MALGSAYAKGKWALGECRRSGRKMLLRNMVADGYYPNLIVDPQWYEPKHPQESLPKVRDPVSLFRPAPDQDRSNACIRFRAGSGSHGFHTDTVSSGYSLGNPSFNIEAAAAQDASAYGTSEDELANNPESVAGGFRQDIFWKPDGTRVYTARQSAEIAQQDPITPWDIQNQWANRVATPNIGNLRSCWWSPDGTRLSACTRVPSFAFNIRVWDQSSTPWDLTVLGAETNKSLAPGGPAGGPADHIWSADGLTCWVHYQSATSEILEYATLIPFDPTGLGPATVQRFDTFPDAGTGTRTIAFSTDGTVMYAMVLQVLSSWDLSTAFDITTMANFTTGPSIAAGDLSIPRGINVRSDNEDIFIEGDQNQRKVAWFRL
jgi:hypothetical protein